MTFDKPTPIRDGFGRALYDLGSNNPHVVALTADLSEPLRVHWFAQAYPERFIQMGISESDMMGTAAGLAIAGKIPFATTFAAFATSLANQPVRVSIAYNRANVKIATSHGGICVGGDGATHQSFEDMALMRALPGMVVVNPADANEAYAATFAIAAHEGPVYLRLGRIATPVLTAPGEPFVIGKAKIARAGGDLAIITCGAVLNLALDAADLLAAEGVDARVINMHTVKPLDEAAVLAAAGECGAILTVEEHSVIGGLGGAVAEFCALHAPTPMDFIGVKDTFGESGEPDEIMAKYGLTSAAVVEAGRRVVARKTR